MSTPRPNANTAMKPSRQLATLSVGVLIAALSATTRADDILQHVPPDALGFVVIKNINDTDTKVARLLTTLHARYPSPLVFLEAVTGIREGLNAQGDFLIAMLPANGGDDAAPQFCVWLPVTDYDRLLALLEATPGDPISAVRVADEDLLIARQGDWALLMDPDQRPRMEQMLKAGANLPTAIADWQTWIDGNDVAIVLLRAGIERVLAWSAQPPGSNRPAAEEPTDDLFGQLADPDEDVPFVDVPVAEPTPNPLYDPVRSAVHNWIVRFPSVKDLVSDAEAFGVAARLDEAGNAVAALRLKSTDEDSWSRDTNAGTSLPPALFEKGEFVVHGAGHFPPALMDTIASVYTRRMLDELKQRERIELDEELAAKFAEAFTIAASDVTAWSITHQPGDLKTGVHNNNFLVLRVSSAKSFLAHAADAMANWNAMHRESESDTRYVFDIEESKIGTRVATQYLLDVAATGGMPAIPEMRQLMEKFFGPGGKLRIWLVPVDEHTVLFAAATPEQVTAALQTLDRKRDIDWNQPEFAAVNKLLPEIRDWRVFVSPRGYYEWKRRETEAMNNGVPVIGGKPTKDFSASPPVAVAGRVHDHELQIEAAATADTIKSAGIYFK